MVSSTFPFVYAIPTSWNLNGRWNQTSDSLNKLEVW